MQYAKVGEYQRRGLIHFHALVRLDGPKTPEGFAPAPESLDAARLARPGRPRPPHPCGCPPHRPYDGDAPRLLGFGAQLDARPVRASRRTDDPDTTLTPEQVAGYLAKYATKSATDTGDAHHRRNR